MSSLLDMDPNILVSMVNMKLRDFYSNLDQYCEDADINKDELINKLSKVGYEYNIELTIVPNSSKDINKIVFKGNLVSATGVVDTYDGPNSCSVSNQYKRA